MVKPVYYSEGQLVDETGVPLRMADLSNYGQRIAGVTLTADGTIDFQNLDQTFKHLELVCFLRSNNAAGSDTASLTINNDTTAGNYRKEEISAWAGTLTSAEATSGRTFINPPAATSPAGAYGMHRFRFSNYSTPGMLRTWEHTGSMWGGITSLSFIFRLGMGLWNSTVAINRLAIAPNTGTLWVAGSYAEVIGYRSGF